MSERTQLTEPPPVAVAVIGLGDMGSALARAFLANRHRVTVWNRTAAKATPLVQAGAQQAKSVEAAVAAGDVIVVCVLDYAISESLLTPPPALKWWPSPPSGSRRLPYSGLLERLSRGRSPCHPTRLR